MFTFPSGKIVPLGGSAEIFSFAFAHVPHGTEPLPNGCSVGIQVFRQVPATVVAEIGVRGFREAARRKSGSGLMVTRLH